MMSNLAEEIRGLVLLSLCGYKLQEFVNGISFITGDMAK